MLTDTYPLSGVDIARVNMIEHWLSGTVAGTIGADQILYSTIHQYKISSIKRQKFCKLLKLIYKKLMQIANNCMAIQRIMTL